MAGGFWVHATEDPSYLAVVDPDGTEYTAGELLARSNQLVHGLRSLGLQPGDAIAEVLPNGVAPVELFLAATQAGFYLTPINFHLTGPEIAYIIKDCEAKAVFVHPRYAEAGTAAVDELDFPKEARFSVGGDIPGFRSVEELIEGQPTTAPDDRRPGLTMHYTSGTTGQPKGVRRPLPDADVDVERRDDLAVPHAVRHPAEGGQRPPRHVAELPHRGHDVRRERAARGPHARVHGQVAARGHAREDRAVRRHPHAHGADPVPPDARPSRRRAGQVRRVVDEVGDPRGRAVPGRREAQDARLVGARDLRVLRGDRGRRHARDARSSGSSTPAPSAPRGRSRRCASSTTTCTTSRPARRAPST